MGMAVWAWTLGWVLRGALRRIGAWGCDQVFIAPKNGRGIGFSALGEIDRGLFKMLGVGTGCDGGFKEVAGVDAMALVFGGLQGRWQWELVDFEGGIESEGAK